MHNYLDFEKPIAELEGKIEALRHQPGAADVNIADQVSELQAKVGKLLAQTYAKLTPWQKTQVARHHDRPAERAPVGPRETGGLGGLSGDDVPTAGRLPP
ncbi:MAG: hypothetical protein MKZ66_10150 [Acidimicrobiales bacterium]|nr:hypothetical protein [Acidimicrobiales bacterium]